MNLPDFDYEELLWSKGHSVIGIDEVGRGAFAGPVGVGGVIFDSKMSSAQKKALLELGINDSKKLSPKKREKLSLKIREFALATYVSFIDVVVINKIGIGKATFLGMKLVFEKLKEHAQNPYLLIDAFTIPKLSAPQRGIIRGDTLSISIAAASIIAKVERDKLMISLSQEFPGYAFEKHKGYGTLNHRKAISQFGLSSLHRKDFCKNAVVFVK